MSLAPLNANNLLSPGPPLRWQCGTQYAEKRCADCGGKVAWPRVVGDHQRSSLQKGCVNAEIDARQNQAVRATLPGYGFFAEAGAQHQGPAA